MNEEFNALKVRIKNAKGKGELNLIERSVTRIYNGGLLTPKEFGKLDIFIMEKLANENYIE